MEKIEIIGKITKIVEDQHLVFGWASIITVKGEPVTDTQDDQIVIDVLEKAAYDFVMDVRLAGEMHKRLGVGQLVESIVFSKEKQDALEIDLGLEGWWIGFKITDEGVWEKIKKGEYPAFSIGGVAERIDQPVEK